MIAAVLGQGLLESERLVHLLDDVKIRPEAPPKITSQVPRACLLIGYEGPVSTSRRILTSFHMLQLELADIG